MEGDGKIIRPNFGNRKPPEDQLEAARKVHGEQTDTNSEVVTHEDGSITLTLDEITSDRLDVLAEDLLGEQKMTRDGRVVRVGGLLNRNEKRVCKKCGSNKNVNHANLCFICQSEKAL